MSLYDQVKSLVMTLLRDIDLPTSEHIKERINKVADMQHQLGRTDPIDKAALHRDIQSLVNTWQPDPSVLRDGDKSHVNWLPSRKAEIKWSFWKRYRQYLEVEKNWPSTVISKLDKITDMTLGNIGNPAQHGRWDRRGMVVGEIQSGKTANYTGLICKAVDADYKLIIVLAGMTNDLRSQTQSRLDAEFLGFESEVGKVHSSGSRIGVGKFDGQPIAHPLTYSARDGDFLAKKSANLQLGGTPILLVVKKQTKVLQRILTWVENQGKLNPPTGRKIVEGIPLLLIDDEADFASVNTKKPDQDPTAINNGIRQILNAFEQSSYVAYTATPYANIFILPDENSESKFGKDLFPEGFLCNIPPPSNYFGPAQLFGLNEDLDGGENTTAGLPLIRKADDAVSIFPLAHKKELKVKGLPDSMIHALRSFVIACAARRVRGQTDVHNSMLIHVTRFNQVQQQVMDAVDAELRTMQQMIEYNTGDQALSLFAELEALWNDDFLPAIKAVSVIRDDSQLVPVQWDEVRAELQNAIAKLVVRAINGDKNIDGVLDYDDHSKGLNIIAVGGDKLSRGLTLEGLSISYFVRPCKNSDSLLQMGRWFGYRPGYIDLCRLFVTTGLVGWFEHTAVANEELRRQFNFMELSNLTPREFGLKVRTHPNGLNITAANKIRHGKKMRVSFAGHLAQTSVFNKESEIHESNFKATEQWLMSLPLTQLQRENRIEWKNIRAEDVIRFLEKYESHPAGRQAEPDLLINYITKLNSFKEPELVNWTVALISNSKSTATQCKIATYNIGLTKRKDSMEGTADYMLTKANILSPEDETIDLSQSEKDYALSLNIKMWEQCKTQKKTRPEKASGPFLRKARASTCGLLLIYPLDNTNFSKPFSSKPIIGFAISFPGSKLGEETAIEYQVNTTYWRDRYGEEDEDDT